MPKKLEEITLVVRCEKHRWDETAIVECERPGTQQALFDGANAAQDAFVDVKVRVEDDLPLEQFCSYRFYGEWTLYKPKRGGEQRQFQADSYTRTQPHGRAGTIKYLQLAEGLGQKRALLLWEKFGGDTVRIVREKPAVVAAALGMGELSGPEAWSHFFRNEQHTEEMMVELLDLLDGKGFPHFVRKKAIKLWGNAAPRKIKANPYSLMRFKGSGFARCDDLYLDLGGDARKLRRQAYAAAYAVACCRDGDTWVSKDVVVNELPRMIGSMMYHAQPLKAVKMAKRIGVLATRWDGRELWLSAARRADHELEIAAWAFNATQQPGDWPRARNLDVSDHQCEQLAKIGDSRLAILGGGPGTGKTYCAARIVAAIADVQGLDRIRVCAPTGKAAQRVTEAMAGYGVALRATTIHSLIGAKPDDDSEEGFAVGCPEGMEFDFVIVDEASMVDTDLLAALFRSLASGCHVLLVGDVNQLPPVGHGAPLRDLIAAGVPYAELTEVRRNSGKIVSTCHAIRRREKFPELRRRLDVPAGDNLGLLPANTDSMTAGEIVSAVKRLKAAGVVDAIRELQVIVAINEKSEVSRQKMNAALQAELNPAGEQAGTNPFRVGDKVVCLKNQGRKCVELVDGQWKTLEDSEVFVANGEQGVVVAVKEKLTIVTLATGKTVGVPRGVSKAGDDGDDESASATGCKWDLGYAISCHKSQGSEWPVVLVALDRSGGAKRICTREWIYTAISRAKTACFLVGDRSTAADMCFREALSRRKTFLREILSEAINQPKETAECVN